MCSLNWFTFSKPAGNLPQSRHRVPSNLGRSVQYLVLRVGDLRDQFGGREDEAYSGDATKINYCTGWTPNLCPKQPLRKHISASGPGAH